MTAQISLSNSYWGPSISVLNIQDKLDSSLDSPRAYPGGALRRISQYSFGGSMHKGKIFTLFPPIHGSNRSSKFHIHLNPCPRVVILVPTNAANAPILQSSIIGPSPICEDAIHSSIIACPAPPANSLPSVTLLLLTTRQRILP